MLMGIGFVGPHMQKLIEQVHEISLHAHTKTVFVHCWRGGMRSSSFAWLLQFFGYEVFVLQGGYKAFRAYTQEIFRLPRKMIILGGSTGSGKTALLQALANTEQVIDLEKLAQHKGSVFGGLGCSAQPTQEQFENDLANAWLLLDEKRPVWLEDESRKIGALLLPESLWREMRVAPVVQLVIPVEQRIAYLCQEYGAFSCEDLMECLDRLHRHLGGQRSQTIAASLQQGDILHASELLLAYYDALYQHGLAQRSQDSIRQCVLPKVDAVANAHCIKYFITEHHVYHRSID